MRAANVHVVPDANGWAVEVEGEQGRAVYPSQVAAIAAGWERAERDEVELLLLLHDRAGAVWARDTFDNGLKR